jgi:hypothetical protein
MSYKIRERLPAQQTKDLRGFGSGGLKTVG